MRVFAVLSVVVLAIGVSTPALGQIRDSIGYPSTAMTDNQPGSGHQDNTFEGGGIGTLVVLDMTQEAPFMFTDWAGVFHGAGTAFGPSGPAPNFANTTFHLVWHRTLQSLESDPSGHGIEPGFDGTVVSLPMHHTEEFFGSTFDPGPRSTVYVAGDTGGVPILISGGYMIIRADHSVGEAVLFSTGSTDPIGAGAPADLMCGDPSSSGPTCQVLPRRHAWMIGGTLVEEAPALRWPAALVLGLVSMFLLVTWRSRGWRRVR